MSNVRARQSWVVLAAVFAAMAPFVGGCAQQPPAGQVKYVFLMIGDGMGPAQRRAGEIFLAGPQVPGGPLRLAKLTMNTLPVFGMARTNPLDTSVTDSAAAGTALATGHKVPFGTLSAEPNTNAKYVTLAELAKAAGWKAGIVSSAPIDDATPAAFYAHQSGRTRYYEISMALAGSGMDYFAGGLSEGSRPRELRGRVSAVEAAKKNGYTVVTNHEQLMAVRPGAGKVWSIWTGADGNQTLYYEMDRPADQPSLPELTRKGIELLDNPEGFFLMVEGGEIDAACHSHDLAAALGEVILFDQAVGVALEFYRKHPAETLIVVTNDHETGGMGLGGPPNGRLAYLHDKVAGQKHSLNRFGEELAQFRAKKMSFQEALPAIREFFGFGDLAAADTKALEEAYALTLAMEPGRRAREEAYFATYGKLDPLSATCANLLSGQAGVGWTGWVHTDMPAPVTAIGPGSEAFTGYYENSDIFHKIRATMALRAK